MDRTETSEQDASELSQEDGSIITYSHFGQIQDIALLDKNFDLSCMPKNYLRRRSKVEELVYRAVASETQKKSPFASFRLAHDSLQSLDNTDIITGMKSIKGLLKMPFNEAEQVSVMVHRIGNTWLLDEFDIDSFFVQSHRQDNWSWFRDFLVAQNFQLCKPDFSRNSLFMRDLYSKFLYHSVNSKSPRLLQLPEQQTCSRQANALEMSASHTDNARSGALEEEFLRSAVWRIEDLSFVVGSDLAIFGTKTHPCISLKLSPYRKPITVLTGIDMWLENIINEVPEVSMCYHNEGIVMQEYEILATDELPRIAGFHESEVEGITRNLVMFLKRNATKEGHTYWLFKEQDSDVVKLYDLSTINANTVPSTTVPSQCSDDMNPFILPVAILCYKMAERRMQQHLDSTEEAEIRFTYLSDAFRLLSNCVCLLDTKKQAELWGRAILLLCKLYLETESGEMARCLSAIEQTPLAAVHEVQLPIMSLLTRGELVEEEEADRQESGNDEGQTCDNALMDAFRGRRFDRIMQYALQAVESIDRQRSLVQSPSTALQDPSGGLDTNLQRILFDAYLIQAEENKTGPVDEFKNAYLAYLVFERMRDKGEEGKVLSLFTGSFLRCHSHLDHLQQSGTGSQPEQVWLTSLDKQVFRYLSPETCEKIEDRLASPSTALRSLECCRSAVLAFRRLRSLKVPNKGRRDKISHEEQLAIAVNLCVHALVDRRSGEEFSDWPEQMNTSMEWIIDAVGRCRRSNPRLGAALCCARARLLRLASHLASDDVAESKAGLLMDAIAAYGEAKEILGRERQQPMFDSIQYDRLNTGIAYYDYFFKQACADKEPNLDLLLHVVTATTPLVKNEVVYPGGRAGIPLAILKMRLVAGNWYLAWCKQKPFEYDAVLKDLRDSYRLLVNKPNMEREVLIALTFLVMVQAAKKDLLSTSALYAILRDAMETRKPLQAVIDSEEATIEIHAEMLTSHLLAVVQRLVKKSTTQRSDAPKSSMDPELKQLYKSLLTCSAKKQESFVQKALNMLNYVEPFLTKG